MPSPAFSPVTPHIQRLELPYGVGPLRLPVAVWLVRDDQGWLMVDAGAPGFENLLLDQVLAATDGQHPRLLILTHGHLDHAAAAGRLRDLWRIPLAAGRAEIPYLTGPDRYARIPSAFPLYRLIQVSPPPLVGRNIQRPLDAGMRLGDLVVHDAPGHAPGMIALHHPGDRALICADAFYNLGGKLTDPAPAFTYDARLNRDTQQRLAALDFDHLLPSHGPVILNTGRDAARALLASKEKKPRQDNKKAAQGASP
jgi:glyoxylase-like metal-dependent hydrolase (beta-lactamase superfamily II)